MDILKDIVTDFLNFLNSETSQKIEKFHKKISHAYEKKWLGCSIGPFIDWIEKQFDEEMDWDNYGEKWELYHILPKSHFPHEKHYWNFHNIVVVSQTQKEILDENLDNYEIYYAHVSDAEQFYIQHV